MSMISSQCGRLRELAIRANELHEYEMERELDQAAYLILELRDDLQRTNAENAALRQQVADVTESMGRVEERCAKLRELVLALADCRNTTCDDCVRWDYPEGGCSLDGVMRELGVELD